MIFGERKWATTRECPMFEYSGAFGVAEQPNPDPAYPLCDFYHLAGKTLPQIESIRDGVMPEPYRSLLVHENDMTPTLEMHHGSRIHLRVLRSVRRDKFYFREVVLVLDGSERPVEFGANKVSLNLFPPEARELILAEYVPLGSILADFRIEHTCHPSAYLELVSDELIGSELKLDGPQRLYGRRNTLTDPLGRILSEVVEILAPAAVRRGNRIR
jgi:chorismate-pyruvate lyase